MAITKHHLAPANGLVVVKACRKFTVLRIEQCTNGATLVLDEGGGEVNTHGFLVTNTPENHELPHHLVPEQKLLGTFVGAGSQFEVWGPACGRV